MADETLTMILEAQRRANDAIDRLPTDLREIEQGAAKASAALAKADQSSGLSKVATSAQQAARGVNDYVPAATRAAQASQQLGQNASKAAGDVNKLGSEAGKSAGDFVKMGASFAAGAAGVQLGAQTIQAAFKATIGAASSLQTEVNAIKTIKPDIDTSAIFKSLNEMQTRVPQSATSLAEGLYNIFSSIEIGADGALSLLEQFARGATAARTDTETFGTAILGVLNAYKLGAADASHISDVFFNTIRDGVVSGSELASSLGTAVAAGKAAGLTFEQLGGFIVGVTREGGNASQNINNLVNLLNKITTTDAQKALQDLGIQTVDATGKFRPLEGVLADLRTRLAGMTEAQKANALQAIFPDAQARQGAQVIMSQLEAVNKSIEANKTQVGSAATAYATMTEGAAVQWALLQGQLRAIFTALGAYALPVLTQILGFLIQVAAAGAGAIEPIASAISGLAGNQAVVAALGAAFLYLLAPGIVAVGAAAAGGTVALTGFIAAFLIANAPIIAIAVAIGLVAAGIVLLIKHWSEITAAIPALGVAFDAVKTVVVNAFKALIAPIVLWLELLNKIPGVSAVVGQALDGLKTMWEGLQSGASGGSAAIQTAAGEAKTAITDIIPAAQAAGTEGAAKLTPLQQMIKDIAGDASKAVSEINKLGAEPTQVMLNMQANIANAAGSVDAFTLALSLSGPEQAYWIGKAREMAGLANDEGQSLRTLNRVLDDVRAGRITAAQGIKQYEDATQKVIDKKQLIVDAEAAHGKAAAATAVAEVSAAKDVAKSADEKAAAIGDASRVAQGHWTDEEKAAFASAAKINQGMENVANPATQATVANNVQTLLIPFNDDVPAAAQRGVDQGNARLKLLGDNIDLAGPPKLATQIGPPIEAASSNIVTLVNATLAKIGMGVQVNTTHVGAQAANGVSAGFFAAWGGVSTAINGAINNLVARQMAAAAGEQSPSTYTITIGENMALGVGVGWDDAYSGVQRKVISGVDELTGELEQRAVAVFQRTGEAVAESGDAAQVAGRKWYDLSGRAADARAALADVGTAAASSVPQIAGNEAAIARLALAIGQLQDMLLYAEPHSAHAAAIQSQIQILEAWKAKEESVISVLELEKAAIEANTTALEKFNQERSKAANERANVAALGAGGAGVLGAAQTAFGSRDRGDIRSALDSVDELINDLRERGVPNAEQLGEDIVAAIGRGLAAADAGDDAGVQAAVADIFGILQPVQAAADAAGRLTGETFAASLDEAMNANDLRTRVGERAAGIFGQITTAVKEQTPQTRAAVAESIAGLITDINKLPEALRGTMAEDLRAASIAWANAPNDPEARAVLEAAVTAATSTIALIPAEWAKLPVQAQDAYMRMAAEVVAGNLTLEEAVARGAAITQMVGANFAELPALAQGYIAQFANAVEAGLMTPEEAIRRFNAITKLIPEEFERLPEPVRNALRRLAAAVADGTMDSADAARRGAEITSAALRALGSEFPEVRAAAQSYIDALVEGGPINYQFAEGLKLVEEQARLTAKGIADAAAHTRALAEAERDANNKRAGYTPGPGLAGAAAAGGGAAATSDSSTGARENASADRIYLPNMEGVGTAASPNGMGMDNPMRSRYEGIRAGARRTNVPIIAMRGDPLQFARDIWAKQDQRGENTEELLKEIRDGLAELSLEGVTLEFEIDGERITGVIRRVVRDEFRGLRI